MPVAGSANAADITGTPGKIVDGDTLWVCDQTACHKIRLCGIDAPELSDPRGPAASVGAVGTSVGATVGGGGGNVASLGAATGGTSLSASVGAGGGDLVSAGTDGSSTSVDVNPGGPSWRRQPVGATGWCRRDGRLAARSGRGRDRVQWSLGDPETDAAHPMRLGADRQARIRSRRDRSLPLDRQAVGHSRHQLLRRPGLDRAGVAWAPSVATRERSGLPFATSRT